MRGSYSLCKKIAFELRGGNGIAFQKVEGHKKIPRTRGQRQVTGRPAKYGHVRCESMARSCHEGQAEEQRVRVHCCFFFYSVRSSNRSSAVNHFGAKKGFIQNSKTSKTTMHRAIACGELLPTSLVRWAGRLEKGCCQLPSCFLAFFPGNLCYLPKVSGKTTKHAECQWPKRCQRRPAISFYD